MDKKYWEQMAPTYDNEIFDVLKNDRKNLILSALKKSASKGKTASDLGCAVGKWLPVLSPLFKKVIAVDISKKNLSIAAERHAQLHNVSYQQADLSSPEIKLPVTDVAVCVNAILSPVKKKRDQFFRNISASVKTKGTLLLVVPSLESWMLTRIVQSRYEIDKRLFKKSLPAVAAKRYGAIQEGNAEIDEVLTKHYLADELRLLLKEFGFSVTTLDKIGYDWHTEFVDPPETINHVQPWDWFVVATRVR